MCSYLLVQGRYAEYWPVHALPVCETGGVEYAAGGGGGGSYARYGSNKLKFIHTVGED